MLVFEKINFVYPYDADVRFPAYIWQTWKHGLNDEKFDEKYREGERQWAYKTQDLFMNYLMMIPLIL